MVQLVNTINALNDKEIKYKMVNEDDVVSIVFGIMVKGEKSRVYIVPSNEDININIAENEKNIQPEELEDFLNTILELRVVQEQEDKLFKALLG